MAVYVLQLKICTRFKSSILLNFCAEIPPNLQGENRIKAAPQFFCVARGDNSACCPEDLSVDLALKEPGFFIFGGQEKPPYFLWISTWIGCFKRTIFGRVILR
jgi:hypothetical protein